MIEGQWIAPGCLGSKYPRLLLCLKQIRCFFDRNWLLVIGYWANYQLLFTNYRYRTSDWVVLGSYWRGGRNAATILRRRACRGVDIDVRRNRPL